MGAAYYVVLNADDPGFDTTVDGKALARNRDQIDIVATRLGYKNLDSYVSVSRDDAVAQMLDLLGLETESDLPGQSKQALDSLPPENWYDPEHGLQYTLTLSSYIEKKQRRVRRGRRDPIRP